jgi:pyruvate carboxylase
VFESGKTWTTFIDDTPELFKLVQSQNRAQKLLAYLGDVAVNGSSIKGQMGDPGLETEAMIPQIKDKDDPTKVVDTSVSCQTGWRNIIVNEGPEAFAKAIRNYKGCVSPGDGLRSRPAHHGHDVA